jgi:hypothetical protein
MDINGKYPSPCPYEGDSDQCGYLEEREPTKYLLRKKRLIHEAFT